MHVRRVDLSEPLTPIDPAGVVSDAKTILVEVGRVQVEVGYEVTAERVRRGRKRQGVDDGCFPRELASKIFFPDHDTKPRRCMDRAN